MNSKKETAIISNVFFLSGASALIFETIWFRVASTVLGSSVWSAAAVLMAFMGGLAIGNALMAAHGHRVKNPAKFYLAIEAVIGITGFLVVLLLPKLSPFVGTLLISLSEDQGLLSAGRFIIACLFLLLPAIAMGATLPVMQKLSHQYDDSFVKSIARLYGWNTVGAVCGVLLAEFVFIKYLGIIGTAATASAFNLFVILIILKFFGNSERIVDKQEPGKLNKNIIRYLAAAFFSGLLLLALEIVWFRYLLVSREGTSIIFAIMLAAVLIGIGSGGLIVSRLKLQSSTIKNLVFLIPIMASISTLSGFYFFQWYFDHYVIDIIDNIFYFILAISILILPTCLMSGMIFPLLGECIYKNNQVTTSSSGYLTLANTIGAVIGSALASFYLLPQIGIENSILFIVLAYALVSIFLIENAKKQIIAVCIVMLFVIIVFPHGLVNKSFMKQYSKSYPDADVVLAFREGLNQTIAYLENKYVGQKSTVRLVTNNYSMSTTGDTAQRYMRLYSYFPYLLSNKIEDVLQISYGVGNTAESVVMLPDMKHFDVVDMSEDILELSSIAHMGTGIYPLRDKRTVAHVEDGRFFLQTTPNKYDLITAEPPPPMMAGVVNLYTQEYFQLIFDALNPEGISTYWLPLHALGEENALAIIKSFCNIFTTCSLWNGAKSNFMLVGSKSKLNKIDLAQLTKKLTPEMSVEFARIGFDVPEQVFATYIGDYAYLSMLTQYVAPVTDNYPQRITTYRPGTSKISGLYRDFYAINRRKESFINSAYIKSIFTSELISSIASEFTRQGIITSTLISDFNDVILDKDFNYWDTLLEYISKNKRDYVSLGLLNVTPSEMKAMDKAFVSEPAKKTYYLEYILYLFIDNKFNLLETEVKKVIANDIVSNSNKSLVYRYYLLSKIIQKTAKEKDIITYKELNASNPDYEFSTWYMKHISNEP